MSKILKFIENRIKSIKILHIRWIYKRTIPLWMIIFSLIIISSSIALFILLGIDFFEKNNDSTFFIGILSAGLIFFFGTIIYLIRYHQIEKHRKEEHKEFNLANNLKDVKTKIKENKEKIEEFRKYYKGKDKDEYKLRKLIKTDFFSKFNANLNLKIFEKTLENINELEDQKSFLISWKNYDLEKYKLKQKIEKIQKNDLKLFIYFKKNFKKIYLFIRTFLKKGINSWIMIGENTDNSDLFKNIKKILNLEKFIFIILLNTKEQKILFIFFNFKLNQLKFDSRIYILKNNYSSKIFLKNLNLINNFNLNKKLNKKFSRMIHEKELMINDLKEEKFSENIKPLNIENIALDLFKKKQKIYNLKILTYFFQLLPENIKQNDYKRILNLQFKFLNIEEKNEIEMFYSLVIIDKLILESSLNKFLKEYKEILDFYSKYKEFIDEKFVKDKNLSFPSYFILLQEEQLNLLNYLLKFCKIKYPERNIKKDYQYIYSGIFIFKKINKDLIYLNYYNEFLKEEDIPLSPKDIKDIGRY